LAHNLRKGLLLHLGAAHQLPVTDFQHVMIAIFGIPIQALLGQLLLGLVNGSFYAVLSLGLAVIFGLLNVINFAHGALYMLGAFVAWMGLQYLGLNYWMMLLIAPLLVGLFGIIIERT